MNNKENISLSQKATPCVTIFDTEDWSERQKFVRFRDNLASKGMPWRFEIEPETHFAGRFISAEWESNLISRAQVTPLVATRSEAEIANSAEECFYVCYISQGSARVEQDGHETCGGERSLMIFDGSSPVKVTEHAERCYDVFSLMVPKSRFEGLENINSLFRNIAIKREQLDNSFAACLTALMMTLPTASPDEVTALYDATTILLPMAAGRRKEELSERLELISSRYARALSMFIEDNIDNPRLSPGMVADSLNVSVRYIHRQFAINGTTFGTYVRSKRLEGVRRDLISEANNKTPISALAFRWGFSDLSTFTRAFKKRFNCSPRDYKSKA